MCKSLRNQLTEAVELVLVDALVGDIPPWLVGSKEIESYKRDVAKERLGTGESFRARLAGLDDEDSIDFDGMSVYIQGGEPVMSLVIRVPDDEGGRTIVASGYSKLKKGDTWDSYEAYKICVRRAARDYADKYFVELHIEIERQLDIINEAAGVISKIEKKFFTGKCEAEVND